MILFWLSQKYFASEGGGVQRGGTPLPNRWKITFHLRTDPKVYGTLYYFMQDEPNSLSSDPYDFYKCHWKLFESAAERDAFVYDEDNE